MSNPNSKPPKSPDPYPEHQHEHKHDDDEQEEAEQEDPHLRKVTLVVQHLKKGGCNDYLEIGKCKGKDKKKKGGCNDYLNVGKGKGKDECMYRYSHR